MSRAAELCGVSIPVFQAGMAGLAAGGIVDARSVRAARCLGTDGAWVAAPASGFGDRRLE